MQTRAIKSKIKSTQSIRKITRTMEMVSVAKMKKALATADEGTALPLEANQGAGDTWWSRSEKHPFQNS